MRKAWFEDHYKALRVLLLILAGLNGWMAYAMFPDHPILASVNCAMGVLIVLGVILSRRTGGPN